MTPALFVEIALSPALRLLPAQMDSPAARAMMITIALQESRLLHRRQIGGPARGYAQFEMGGGVRGVLTHRASAEHAKRVCAALDYQPTPDVVYAAIEHNDILACVFSRLLLWTLPGALPARSEHDKAWSAYIAAWRPGKPHRSTWNTFYDQAWIETGKDA